MRRLDLHPAKKLRNPGRHLRKLARWPQQIVGHLPDEAQQVCARFWNYKVPVFSKVVDPPHATPEAHRACIAAMFAAAEAIERSGRRPRRCRVACLVAAPAMFQSEVTLFFDDDYFRTFLSPEEKGRTYYEGGWVEAEAAEASALGGLAPDAPAGLEFFGGTLMRQYETGWTRPMKQTTWVWAFQFS